MHALTSLLLYMHLLDTPYLHCFSLDLQHEIEDLKAKLSESKKKLEQLPNRYADERLSHSLQLARLQEEFDKHKEKYDR